MKIGAIVQARMNSKRFSGKTLYKVAGKPILQYVLERLSHCSHLDTIVVATSKESSDMPIVEYCRKYNVPFCRGSLLNVSNRFINVLQKYQFNAFVRVSGDSPLIDQKVIERGIEIFIKNKFDLVTNVHPRTYPKGQSVEVLKSDIFCDNYKLMKNQEDLEHVTKYFYRNENCFKIFNFRSSINYENIKLSVDTVSDMNIFAEIISNADKPHWEYTMEDIVRLYKNTQEK